MSRPDLLLISDGASPHTRRLAAGLAQRGLAVEIATFEGAGVPGVREHRLGRRPATEDLRYALAVPALARVIAGRRPRVVHAHYVSSYGLMAALARLCLPRPPGLVQTAWGTDLLVTARRSRLRRQLAAFALRQAALVTADSNDLLAEVSRLAPAVPRLRMLFGPPRALFDRTRVPERLILSVRRLDPPLRVPLVVSAFRRAREIAPDTLAGWRLVVAGTGSDEAAVRELMRGDGSIDLVGSLQQDELHALLLRAHAFVSVPTSDGTSAALLEAMAAGVVPVVNGLPANREWVDDRIGLVVPRDPEEEELAHALIGAIGREPDVAAIRARVRPAVWEEQVAALAAAYPTQ